MADSHPVLITGGAGYIGSHAALAFRNARTPVVVLDDLSTGRRERVPEDVPFVEDNAGARGTGATIVPCGRRVMRTRPMRTCGTEEIRLTGSSHALPIVSPRSPPLGPERP